MKEEGTRKQETEVKEIRKFLDTLKMPERLITKTKQQFFCSERQAMAMRAPWSTSTSGS